jgi:superfamily II DNA or RNA helicase
MYKILINIKNDITEISINDENIDDIIKNIDSLVSFSVPNAYYTILHKQYGWNGIYHFLKNKSPDTITVPTGIINEVIEYLKMIFDIDDIKITYPIKPNKVYNFNDFDEKLTLRYYQEKSIELLQQNSKFIINLPTGSGKTIIIALIIKNLGINTVVCVPTKEILYQTYEKFILFFGKENVGILGDGIKNISKITICTIQSLYRIKNEILNELKIANDDLTFIKSIEDEKNCDISFIELNQLFKRTELLLVDECHIMPSFTFYNTIMRFSNAYYKIGLTATAYRSDGLDMKMFACLGKIAYKVSTNTLIEEGYLVPAEIKIIDTTIDLPYKNFKTIYSKGIVHNDKRNKIICDIIKKYENNNKIMILVDYIEHGMEIINMYKRNYGKTLKFLNGNEITEIRNEIKSGFEGKFNVLVATTIADIGLDFPFLNILILAGGGKSKVKLIQRIGRTLRLYPNKKKALIFDFMDKNKYLFEHTMERINVYKNKENGFKIIT